MAAEDNRATLIKLLDKLREVDTEYAEKREAILSEMSTLLKGGEGIGPKITRLKAAWQDAWKSRHGGAYLFVNHAMVGASLKRFLQAHDEEEIGLRMLSFVRSDEGFYVRAKHPFEMFVKVFNQMEGRRAVVPDDGAMARQREMRGGG